ncbi:ABC transporter ATP-binding protein, partial [Corynebacterium simulans]
RAGTSCANATYTMTENREPYHLSGKPRPTTRIAPTNYAETAYGATDEVFDNPQHAYTKALLSAIPIPDPAVERNRKRVIYEEHAS